MAEEKEEKIVKLTDEVSVYATKKDKFHKEGEQYSVHPSQVDYLVSNGLATKEAPKADKK